MRVYVHSIDQDKGLTFGQLRVVGDGLAAFLADAGIAANDRVLLLAENSVEFHALFVGVLRYGATIVTVNVGHEPGAPRRDPRRGATRDRHLPEPALAWTRSPADARRWSSSAPGSRMEAAACSPISRRDGTAPTYARSRAPTIMA